MSEYDDHYEAYEYVDRNAPEPSPESEECGDCVCCSDSCPSNCSTDTCPCR